LWYFAFGVGKIEFDEISFAGAQKNSPAEKRDREHVADTHIELVGSLKKKYRKKEVKTPVCILKYKKKTEIGVAK
jgi:hypothetical protein